MVLNLLQHFVYTLRAQRPVLLLHDVSYPVLNSEAEVAKLDEEVLEEVVIASSFEHLSDQVIDRLRKHPKHF